MAISGLWGGQQRALGTQRAPFSPSWEEDGTMAYRSLVWGPGLQQTERKVIMFIVWEVRCVLGTSGTLCGCCDRCGPCSRGDAEQVKPQNLSSGWLRGHEVQVVGGYLGQRTGRQMSLGSGMLIR